MADQIYHPKRMKDDAYAADFRAMPRENQQDMLRFWHFQSVAAESKVYQTLCGGTGDSAGLTIRLPDALCV